MKIDGSIALVTGGASGIGKAICERLLQCAAKVNFLDINKKAGEDVQRTFNAKYGPGQVKFVYCDVSSKEQLEEAFKTAIKENGRLDVVVNNAAVMDEKDWERTLHVNLSSVIHGTFLAIEHLKNAAVINLSSTGGIHPVSFCPVYCASKFGVVGFTRSVAPTAFRKKGIRVNCVCPGGTDTEIYRSIEKMDMTAEQKELATNTPKQTPDAVAQCVVNLIEDENDVGQVVKVTYDEGVEYLNYNDVVI